MVTDETGALTDWLLPYAPPERVDRSTRERSVA
jgi:hypothetical protein